MALNTEVYHLDLDRVSVEFPYKAYSCQLDYMRAVIAALKAKNNALLESPTGTGKTLCLFCAALGWRRHVSQNGREVKICFSSRTHSQLRQVMAELKKTSYKPKSVVLASREHLCTHEDVRLATGAQQKGMCRKARKENKCRFWTGFQNQKRAQKKLHSTDLHDIEEIVSTCKDAGVCPYYKARDDLQQAELLLLPYDYIISRQTRESMKVSLEDCVLIFDEGHNIPKFCELSASFELSRADIIGARIEIETAQHLMRRDQGAKHSDLANFNMISHIIYELETDILGKTVILLFCYFVKFSVVRLCFLF